MAVYRCNNCGLVAEDITLSAGTKISCQQCTANVTLFDTVFYVGKLVERYLAISRELDTLRSQEDDAAISPRPSLLKDQISNTVLLATQEQHQPLLDWFTKRKIKVRFDYSLVDTTGFFDEAANIIGAQYAQLSGSIEQVRHAYRQDWSWINLDLNNKAPQDKQIIKDSFRQLYSHTFFGRYFYQKQKDVIGLDLQSAQQIRKFFTGGWLEWWVFMRLVEICLERGVEFSGARGAQIEFQNEEEREIDVMLLLKKSFPVVIECKSGEFRPDLEKYSKLRQRLGLDKSQFVLCNPDLTDEQITGFNAMYDLTFANLQSFPIHMNILIQ